jgi:ornithine cyclodeaminase/alanine dehydrogenase-like protein (mu-crystallin family)
MALLLDRNAVKSVFGVEEALAAARAAFLTLAHQKVDMPQRLSVRISHHRGTHLTMPCYAFGSSAEALTMKVATVFEDNPSARGIPATLAFLLLHDPKTGELRALMDAEYLTAMRTAAASALATDLLAPPEASRLTIFGAGNQAAAHVEAMRAVRPITAVTICSRTPERAERLADSLTGVEPQVEPDPHRAIIGADIVCTATTATSQVFSIEALPESVHINAVGAFRPDMCELPPTLFSRCLTVVDQRAAAQAGAGDLIQAADQGLLDWEDVVELGELLLRPRGFSHSVTVFKSVGLAVQDALAADFIYRRAGEEGLGLPFSLS